jgi:hypothetical protein
VINNSLPEDDAALYVLGGLTSEERREFKARLAESAELRELVRQLEEGAVAMSMTSPKKLPPNKVWKGIEKVVAKESRQTASVPLFSGGWWRNGWAAAAACLVGWILYSIWPARPVTAVPTMTAASDAHSQPVPAQTPGAPESVIQPRQPSSTDAVYRSLQASLRQVMDLKVQVGDLQDRVARLSQSVTQQQAMLGESNRLKFVQLTPAANGSNLPMAPELSPDLQRALALAMSRELGWAQFTATNGGEQIGSESGPLLTTVSNVDFVDFRHMTNGVSAPLQIQPPQPQPQPQPQNQPEKQVADTPAAAPPLESPHSPIPAFISGQNVVLAVDQTIAPKGTQLSVFSTQPDQSQQLVGTATLGENPIVFTLPLGTSTGFFVSPTGMGLGLTGQAVIYSATLPTTINAPTSTPPP